jgi:hypothetical protein
MVPVHEHRFHRKDAKSAKYFFVSVKEFLCVLCVFAVSFIFLWMDTGVGKQGSRKALVPTGVANGKENPGLHQAAGQGG